MVAVASGVAAGRLIAQEKPLRAELRGAVSVGHTAPDIVWPYVTAAGPGPVDQPFHLRAELGRRVVLFFPSEATGDSARRQWEHLAAVHDSVFGAAVVIGVLPAGAGRVAEFAASLAIPYKFLADSTGRLFRRYGVSRPGRGALWTVTVVSDLGTVVLHSTTFRADDTREMERLAGALRGQ
jgi:peroxiredoxin